MKDGGPTSGGIFTVPLSQKTAPYASPKIIERHLPVTSVSKEPRKRSRITWSCTNCRRGKQRCDRETPCRTCRLRNKQDTCNYGEPTGVQASNLMSGTSKSDLWASSGDNSRASTREQSQTTGISNSMRDSLQKRDLLIYGYSNFSPYNSIGILHQLEQHNLQTGLPLSSNDFDIFTSSTAYHRYNALVRQLPCHECTHAIVDLYFYDVNWQHTLLDRNYFDGLHERFALAAPGSKEQDIIAFPAVLFQVLALGLQFMPYSYSCGSGKACTNNESKYSDASAELLLLLKRDMIGLPFLLAEFLRVSWLKNRGLILEAWKALSQAVRDAQEMGLHHDTNTLEATSTETACEQLWDMLMKRRTIVNLFLWDSQMAMVLGKPMNFSYDDCSFIIPPTDCDVPRDPRLMAPTARKNLQDPSPFTLRLLEYFLARNMRDVRTLELQGPSPSDYTKVIVA
ncbi:hypothetical protein F5884DRAFT_798571 [Xylogone sp. PMI_703]|nr:hypothetical protein F5884DRAFT_798571 [Xylogone sp. PMI_703]